MEKMQGFRGAPYALKWEIVPQHSRWDIYKLKYLNLLKPLKSWEFANKDVASLVIAVILALLLKSGLTNFYGRP